MSEPLAPSFPAHVLARRSLIDDIRKIVVDELRVPLDAAQIDPDTPLFGTGLAFDSIDAVDLVIAIERELEVRVGDDVHGRLALRSVNMLASYILAVRGEGV